MIARSLPLFVLLLASPALAVPVSAVEDPRPRDSWVSDMAEVLEPAAEERIDTRIDQLNADLGMEIGVVTVDDVPGTPKAFATELFNTWGIGQAEVDNGLLVLLVLGQRRLEMEVGDGLEALLPSDWLGEMQREVMVPAFKQGDFGGGIEAGLVAVDARLRAGPAETPADPDAWVPPASAPASSPTPSDRPTLERPAVAAWHLTSTGLALGGGGVATVIALAGSLLVARRRRYCPQCQVRMPLVDEVADDAHLDRDQLAEERLGSIDWDVRICPSCQFSRVIPHRKWFSGYRKCKKCKRRTMTRKSVTEVAATYDHGGRVRVTEDCKHCSHHASWTRSTAKRTRPSSSSSSSSSSWSSSSSSSSWGGGSSSGGGAGSSW